MNAKLVKIIRPLFDLRTRAAKKKFRIARRKANRATTFRSIQEFLGGAPRWKRQTEMYRARRRKLLKITKRSRRINRPN